MADRGPPQLALELVDPFGELHRAAGNGDVGIRPAAGREPDRIVRQPGQERQHEPRMVERREVPRLGAPEVARPGAQVLLRGSLGPGGVPIAPAIRIVVAFVRRFGVDGVSQRIGPARGRPGHPDRALLADEVAQLRRAGGIRSQPAPESVLDAFEMGQGRIGQEVRSARWQLPVGSDGVEELAGPPDEGDEPIELGEAGVSEPCHRVPWSHASRRRAFPARRGGPRSVVPQGHPSERRDGPAEQDLKVPSSLRYAAPVSGPSPGELLSAEILSIGSELTVGETRDTNAGELARSLTEAGVQVGRLQALPDHLTTAIDAFRTALDRTDLVVSTGGLGPTPDDLTREAIAAACDETPAVDPDLEAWLHALWARRGLPFPAINLKQAWRIPSATAIPNENGTAPGWWVDRLDGRVVVALPGPPREMRPMWRDWVLPRLRAQGLGAEVAQTTYRLAGIGESAVADLLGEEILRSTNPIVATYARQDAVDVRVSARAGGDRSAAELVASAAGVVRERLGDHVWATGETSWGEAVGARLDELGWSLATIELGTGGALAHLLGSVPRLVSAEVRGGSDGSGSGPPSGGPRTTRAEGSLAARTAGLLRSSGADVALAVRARPRAGDTAVSVVVVTPAGTHRESRLAFLSGEQGRHRAALAAADILLRRLRA